MINGGRSRPASYYRSAAIGISTTHILEKHFHFISFWSRQDVCRHVYGCICAPEVSVAHAMEPPPAPLVLLSVGQKINATVIWGHVETHRVE
jgi:hypothetical protein